MGALTFSRSGPARRGFVLVLVLLLLLAFTGLAHASLVLLRMHRRTGAVVGAVRARQWGATSLAAAGARALDSLPDSLSLDTTTVVIPGGRALTWSRRLSPELALVSGRVDSAGVGSEAGALAWALDPVARLAALPRAVETGMVTDPATRAAVGEGETTACPSGLLPPVGSRPLVGVRAGSGPGASEPLALGYLSADTVLARLEPLSGAWGTPAPAVSDGACAAAPWNWGDPLDPESPCAQRFVGLARAGDLEVRGGVGQGLLVVDGDLVLSGVTFRGMVLVAGDLRVDAGARIEGVARVGGSFVVADGGWVAGPCAAYTALVADSTLRRPVVLPRPGWSLP